MTIELKEWLNSINFSKENLIVDDKNNLKDYPPFVINRCLSGHIDCILFANEMNMHHQLDKDMQYSFYLNSLRKKKRFSPWIRKDTVKDIDCIKRYYNYSNEKAHQALKILNKKQIDFIKSKFEIGGTK